MKRKFIAFALALLMLAAYSVPVLGAATSQTSSSISNIIEGGTDIFNPPISVVVPTTLNFAFNPFYAGNSYPAATPTTRIRHNQVTPQDFQVLNRTPAYMATMFFLDATLEDDVTLLEFNTNNVANDLNPSDITYTDKNLMLAVVGANTITAGATGPFTANNFAALTTAPVIAYEATPGNTLVAFDPVANGSSADSDWGIGFGFLLDPAVRPAGTPANLNPAPNAFAADNYGFAAFTFFSRMNAYAGWAANDVSVSGVLWLQAIHPQTAADLATHGHNLIATASLPTLDDAAPTTPMLGFHSPGYGITVADEQNATLTIANLSGTNATGTIFVPFAGLVGQTVAVSWEGIHNMAASGNWTVDSDGLTFTATRANQFRGLLDDRYLVILVDGVSHTLNIVVPTPTIRAASYFETITGVVRGDETTVTITTASVETGTPLLIPMTGLVGRVVTVAWEGEHNMAAANNWSATADGLLFTASRANLINGMAAGPDRYLIVTVGGEEFTLNLATPNP